MSEFNNEDDENIRKPDNTYNECLIDDCNNFDEFTFNTNGMSEDEQLAMMISFDEYFQYLEDTTKEQLLKQQEDEIFKKNQEEENRILREKQQEAERIQNEMRIRAEEIMQKKRQIYMERQTSLQNFCQRLRGWTFTEKDLKLKTFVENILMGYFKQLINQVHMDAQTYKDFYEIIDTYYIIPASKNKKTAITLEEDNILRNIFCK